MRWSASLLLVLVLVLALCTLRCHSQNYNIIYNEAELVPPGRSRAPHCTATFWGIIHDVFVVKQLHQQCFNKIPKASAQQDWKCSQDDWMETQRLGKEKLLSFSGKQIERGMKVNV